MKGLSNSVWKEALALMALVQVFAACGTSAPSRFYTLSPVATSAAAGTATAYGDRSFAPRVEIISVDIPDYLDRSEIVTRTGSNRLQLAEFDRWGGELRADIARVLGENLSVQLPGNRVSIMKGRRATPAQYNVSVHVARFEPVPGGVVWLKAQWIITGQDGHSVLARSDSDLNERIEGNDYTAMVAAMSRAVDRLGNEIAAAIKPLLAKPALSEVNPKKTGD